MSSCQPYRDFRKKDKAPSPGAGGGGTLASQGAPTKRAVGRVNRFGVTSFTSIRDSETAKDDAYSFDEEPNSGTPSPASTEQSASVPRQAKPKKFFKSRNRNNDAVFDSLFSAPQAQVKSSPLAGSKPASPAVPSPLSSANKSSSSSPSPVSDSPGSPVVVAKPPIVAPAEVQETPVPKSEKPENSADDDPPSTVSRRAPTKSYSRKRGAAALSTSENNVENDAKVKEARTETPYIEYENPLLKNLNVNEIAASTPAAPPAAEIKKEEKPGGRKTFFKSKKTDPAAAKANAVSRYKFFNNSVADEEDLGEKPPAEPFLKKENPHVDAAVFDDEFAAPAPPEIKSYAKVRNVKKAYEVHEIGEAQEFNDDVEYLLESVTQTNSLVSRCLSVCSLASKCMSAQFRVHLRAHGVMTKFFGTVKDAPKHPSLALCVSALFFVLSQDRLTMDLEASTLAILLQLFEINDDAGEGNHKEKVFQLCEQIRRKGFAKHLDMNHITSSSLALETLLSLTSRRAGEWFKEELRIQGGLTHLANLVSQVMNSLDVPHWGVIFEPSGQQLEKLKKIDRVLRVLENVTFGNSANQEYLIKFRNGVVMNFCADLMNLCFENIEYHKVLNVSDESAPEGQSITVALQRAEGPGPVFLSVMLSLLKVMLNVTHENDESSDNWGSRDQTMRQLLECMLHIPYSLDAGIRFDVQLLALGLTINISEHSPKLREWLLKSKVRVSSETELTTKHNAFSALVDLFKEKQVAAAASENQTNEILDNQEEKVKQQEMKRLEDRTAKDVNDKERDAADDLEETIRKAIQKAGKHMEHSIVSAYLALMLGCVIQGNAERTAALKELNGGNLQSFMQALKKFHDFIDLTGVLGNSAPQNIERILKVLETS
ncbi:wings apart-like protein homolog [Galendromus occidentalis]|uniref:Wings apart-like protein homolog n=1 Tax=Galendromus occidentalis TaxID=34638 RepID=A0AAJ6QRI2_9ACAR|nr:wings apart-like protein homolog [Galendromus occidentalis]